LPNRIRAAQTAWLHFAPAPMRFIALRWLRINRAPTVSASTTAASSCKGCAMVKRAETIFFLSAVLAALVLPALPLVQELRPGPATADVATRAPSDQTVPQQVALAR
jgi:hypothetical protein